MDESTRYLSPDVLARIVNLGLRADRVVEGFISGLHLSPYHGVSVEFADYREYTPGDDIKRLDWRVFGRTNRYYIKLFEEESNLRSMILMDTSASMGYGRGSMTKYDYGATLSASLAALLVRQQDAVGLSLFDQDTRVHLPAKAMRSQLVHIVDTLSQARPDGESRLGEVMWSLAEKMKRRGMVIIVSDLFVDLDRFYESLNRLRFQGHEVLVFHVLDRDELDLPFEGPVIFSDIEGTEQVHAEPWAFRKDYREAMQQFTEEVRRRCQWGGIDYRLLTTNEDLGAGLSHYLHQRRRRGSGSTPEGRPAATLSTAAQGR